jgi:hypothetical protein
MFKRKTTLNPLPSQSISSSPLPKPLSFAEQEAALGLSLICPRIYISCRPSSRGTDLTDSRVDQIALSKFLNTRYSDSSTYALFNLSTKGRDSIDYTVFRNQVIEFPPITRSDLTDETPSLGEISRFIYSLKLWLTWDEGTIAILFCNTGVHRSSVFAALYLHYDNNINNSNMSALERVFSIGRIRESLGLCHLSLRPSWTTLITFAEKELRFTIPPSLPKPYSLTYVVMNLPVLKAYLFSKNEHTNSSRTYHSFDPDRHCLPIVQLFAGAKLAWDSEQAESEYTQLGEGNESEPPMRWDGDKLIISFMCPTGAYILCGDFQLWLLLPRIRVIVPSSPRRGPSLGDLASSSTTASVPNTTDLLSSNVRALSKHNSGHTNTGSSTSVPILQKPLLKSSVMNSSSSYSSSAAVDPSSVLLRLCFNSSMLELGVYTAGPDKLDIFKPRLLLEPSNRNLSQSVTVSSVETTKALPVHGDGETSDGSPLMSMTAAPTTVISSSSSSTSSSSSSSSSLSMSLILGKVTPLVIAASNLDRLLRRSFFNLRNARALQQGASDLSSHHFVMPDAQLLSQLVRDGYDEVAAVCALQRSNNHIGRCREVIHKPAFAALFKESSATRDLGLLRACMTLPEVAAALSVRANMTIRERGLEITDLDCSALIAAAKLGNLVLDGSGLEGDGGGSGGGGSGGGGRRKKKKGKDSDKKEDEKDKQKSFAFIDDEADSSDPSDDDKSEEKEEDDDDDDDIRKAAAVAAAASASVIADISLAPKLFENETTADDVNVDDDDDAVDVDEDDNEDEGGEVPWRMNTHPIFSSWFKQIADGTKLKNDLEGELIASAEKWNAKELLALEPDAEVPSIAAILVPLKEWSLYLKFDKMTKVGLPRPIIEHAMTKEFLNPILLDADPNIFPLANIITQMQRRAGKKSSLTRKKLHWIAIKASIKSIEMTGWSGPPGDLVAAASKLIIDEKEFLRLFTQRPEDANKKKKKKDGDTLVGGLIQLVDHKRAMNAGIALAKLKIPLPVVAACLKAMSCRTGTHLLSGVELLNLVTLAPTEDELKMMRAFKGDSNRLGLCEKFFLAVLDVPNARARAQGLLFQYDFDERLVEARRRIFIFSAAVQQVMKADRLHRFLKAVLVLGNKMNGVDAKHRKGTVRAFTLNSLHQLHMTKTFGDVPVTALVYLIHTLQRVDPDLLKLSSDFTSPLPPSSTAQVKKTSKQRDGNTFSSSSSSTLCQLLVEAKRLPLDAMVLECSDLRQGLMSIETLLKDAAGRDAGGMAGVMAAAGGDGPVLLDEYEDGHNEDGDDMTDTNSSDKVSSIDQTPSTDPTQVKASKKLRKRIVRRRRHVEPLPSFAALAQRELETLQSELTGAQDAYKALLVHFKEASDLAADELFSSLHLFLMTFDGTIRGLNDQKRKAEEAKRRAREKDQLKRKQTGGGDEPSPSEGQKRENEEVVIDGSSSWASVGANNELEEEEEEEEEEEKNEVKVKPHIGISTSTSGSTTQSASGDSRSGLLASIAARSNKINDMTPPPTSLSSSSLSSSSSPPTGGDPRSGLLAAIAARKKT